MVQNDVHVEWVPFRAAPGVTPSALRAAADALTAEFLQAQPGFVHRALLQDADGGWVDCVTWRSRADHDAAMTRFGASPVVGAFLALLEDPAAAGAAMRHYHVAQAWATTS